MPAEPLIPVHGGYRKLNRLPITLPSLRDSPTSCQVAQLAYDVTVRHRWCRCGKTMAMDPLYAPGKASPLCRGRLMGVSREVSGSCLVS